MLVALLAALLTIQAAAPDSHALLVERFLAPDDQPLRSYRAHRHLSASTRNGKIRAEMEVLTAYDPEHGFTYEIVAESGSALVRNRVLLEALRTEQRTVSSAARHDTALTPANYEFVPAAALDDAAATLGVRARRKSAMLVNGTLYLGPEADLLRVEGELADRPSFWTRRVRVNRRYERIAGVHVPVAMESVADIRIVGAATFAMTYRYLEINGQKLEQ